MLIKIILKCIVLITFTFFVSSSYANEYKVRKFFSNSKLELGVVFPSSESLGGIRYRAIRNTYNSQSFLIKKEIGYLSSPPDQSSKPVNWAGFTVITITDYDYDNLGRKIIEAISNSTEREAVFQYSYDSKNRLVCKAIRMNKSSFYSMPNSACILDSPGLYGNDRIEKYQYNQYNNITMHIKAYGTDLEQVYKRFTYNAPGQINTVSDAKGNLTKYTYDGFSRLKKTYFPSKTNSGQYNSSDYEEISYDNNDNKISLRKRSGIIISYNYDSNNRVYKKDSPGTVNDVYYGYDLFGNNIYARFESVNGKGITRSYDGFSRLITDVNNTSILTHSITNSYNKNDSRIRITHSDGKYFNYSYDGEDRLISIRDMNSNIISTQEYDSLGRVGKVFHGISASSNITYDNISRVKTFNHDLQGTTSDIMWTYKYNPSSQVVESTISNSSFIHPSDVIGEKGNYTVNGLNQYIQVNGSSVNYDTNGNLVSDGTYSYSFDFENRLLASSKGNSTLTYDPLGRLNTLISNGITKTFAYDGDALVLEYNGSEIDKRYIHGSGFDNPLLMYSGSNISVSYIQYLLKNPQGSIIGASSNSGYKVFINTYDSYGVPNTNNQGRFGYTGPVIFTRVRVKLLQGTDLSSQIR